jgi:hypothetical protein
LDRFLSAYNYLAKGGKSDIDKYWHKKYIEKYGDVENFVLNGGLEYALKHVEHFRPQESFVYKGDHLMVDFIGKYETLNTDVNVLKKKLGISFQLKELNTNKQKMTHENTLSKNSVTLITELYKQDYLRFDYS